MDALAAYYAARAREYERIYDKPERQADLATLKRLVPASLAGRDVLEVACGTGWFTQFIATTARSVTATDINEDTLALARTKDYPPGRVTLAAADVYNLPAHYRDFTGAFAGHWWSHMKRAERRAFVEILHRALAPGAVVVVLDNTYVEGSSTPIAYVDDDGNSYQRRALDDGSQHDVLKNFPTEAQLRADVEGMASDIEYVELQYYWMFKYRKA